MADICPQDLRRRPAHSIGRGHRRSASRMRRSRVASAPNAVKAAATAAVAIAGLQPSPTSASLDCVRRAAMASRLGARSRAPALVPASDSGGAVGGLTCTPISDLRSAVENAPTTMKWHWCQAQTSPSRVFFAPVGFRRARVSDELSRSTIRARGADVEVRRRCRNRGHGVQVERIGLAPVGTRDRRLWTTRTRDTGWRLLVVAVR